MFGRRFNDAVRKAGNSVYDGLGDALTYEIPTPRIGRSALVLSTVLLAGCASEAITPRAPATTPAPAPIPTARTNTLPMSSGQSPKSTDRYSFDRLTQLELIGVPKPQDRDVYFAGQKVPDGSLEGTIGLSDKHYKMVIKGPEGDQTVEFLARGDRRGLYALTNVMTRDGKVVPNTTDKPQPMELYATGTTSKLTPRSKALVDRVNVEATKFNWDTITIGNKKYIQVPLLLQQNLKPGQMPDPKQNNVYVRIEVDANGNVIKPVQRTEVRIDGDSEETRHYLSEGIASMFLQAELREKPLPPPPRVPTPAEVKAKEEAERKTAVEIEIKRRKANVIVY